jgi:hypothetical protein
MFIRHMYNSVLHVDVCNGVLHVDVCTSALHVYMSYV